MKKNIFVISTIASLALIYSWIFQALASEIENVKWDRLSDRDISPQGRVALSFDDKNWKHAETSHFVYHFTDQRQAETIYIHAEVYYKWIKDFFGISEDEWTKKNHIFIFNDEAAWNDFKKRVKFKAKGDALTTGWELFIYRAPHWVSPRTSLAHEITHIVIFRFLNGPLPLFLNEGFAEFASSRILKMQLEDTEYKLAPLKPITEEEYMPLNNLINLDSYPEARGEIFYRESEWLVRFLIFNYGSEKFYKLLRNVSGGEDFQKSLKENYAMDLETVEAKFKSYALSKS